MADIKTRDSVKGTIKTLDKAAVAGERMKSAYAKIKDKAEHGYYSEESSVSEYAIDKSSHTAERFTDKGVRQLDKLGRNNVRNTKQNIVRAKDKMADLKAKRTMQAAEKKKAQTAAGKAGSQAGRGAGRQTSAGASQAVKTAPQAEKTIRQSAKGAKKTVKTSARSTIKATKNGVKTARTTAKSAIKTTEQTTKAAKVAAKTSVKTAQKAAQAAKTTAHAVKATIKATISAVKAIIAGTKALISAIIAGGWVAIVIILIVVLFGAAISIFGGGSEESSYTPVSAEVEAYTPLIQVYAKQYGISEYVELIKAVMMQESSGKGNDPMQASECGYNTRYPNSPNAITDPEYSVNVGIQNLASCLTAAEVQSPIDMDGIKLCLQGYNFGNGYISWAKSNYGGYTYANAVEFSTTQAAKLGWSSYGDTQYVAHVLRYYPYGRAFSGGNQAIVEVALSQLGNTGGQPYWSWYGFSSRVEWCACFVSWCAEQCGYIDAGAIPKFSLCTDGVAWFQQSGQWQDNTYTPKAGDIIFFDWDGDGSTDHVGIVEKAENGTVYTVEGNSGDACKQRSYALGSRVIYGYGTPAY